ncbi:MAG TPA: dihydropteroate synthase [Methylomirabilota bacterium]|nr:dihydropteroate synthase [Methylomirabilota bacterium]
MAPPTPPTLEATPRAELAEVVVGHGLPVAVIGVINVSPESFHRGSVYRDEALLRAAQDMAEAGAALIDVGARSTAPYLATAIDEAEETARLGRAVELLAAKLAVPVSADTPRPGPARAALEAGARVINDVSTLRDPDLARLVASHSAGLILMASPRPDGRAGTGPLTPVAAVEHLLAEGLGQAREAGIAERRIVVDPGIGFFRDQALPWHEWDARVLADLAALRSLGRPVCVGVSRKSFIGAILGRPDPADRLSGSLAATAIAVANGAAVVRTHDVAQTREAVRVAERLRGGTR